MPRRLTVCLLLVAVPAAGCVSNPHVHGGKLVAEHLPGEDPAVTRTPYKATYVLHQWQEPPRDAPPHTWVPEKQVNELYVRGLGRWDPVGFEKGADGQLLAVAGREKIPVPEGRYCWHVSPETEYQGAQRILHETGETATMIVLVPCATAVSICMLPFFFAVAGLAVFGG
jgi:hypothetical protein